MLAAGGFDARAGAVFSWLGVTQYLTTDAIFATLRYVAGATAAGGGITFDYSVAPGLLSLAERWAYDALAARVRAAGEPWLSSFVPVELVSAARACGFGFVRDLSPDDLHARYLKDRSDRLRLGRLARLLWAGAAAYDA